MKRVSWEQAVLTWILCFSVAVAIGAVVTKLWMGE